jgi:hypothetical protein
LVSPILLSGELSRESGPSLFLVKPLGLRIQVLGFRDSGFSIEDFSNLKILPAPNLSILGSGFDIKI